MVIMTEKIGHDLEIPACMDDGHVDWTVEHDRLLHRWAKSPILYVVMFLADLSRVILCQYIKFETVELKL